MGCGKSSVGRRLPALLALNDVSFIDLDDYIEENQGCSISTIFEEQGEKGFREIETGCLNKVIEDFRGRNLVLSLGGGAIIHNSALIHENTFCVYLKASEDTLVGRLSRDTSRPLMQGPGGVDAVREKVRRLMGERAALYEAVAHASVDTEGLGVQGAARAVCAAFEKYR